MGALIEYCRHNGDCATNDLLLESDFDVDVRFCLDRCGQCYRSPFLVVDGEVVCGETHERIVNDLRESEDA